MNASNPYAPPSTPSVAKSNPKSAGLAVILGLIAIVGWSGFASWFSFFGQRIGKLQNLFGFGGVGLCLIGAPIIGALIFRRSPGGPKLRIQCLLNVFGSLVFIAGVRMLATGDFTRHTWWLFAVMGLLMMGLTVIINLLQTRLRNKGALS